MSASGAVYFILHVLRNNLWGQLQNNNLKLLPNRERNGKRVLLSKSQEESLKGLKEDLFGEKEFSSSSTLLYF